MASAALAMRTVYPRWSVRAAVKDKNSYQKAKPFLKGISTHLRQQPWNQANRKQRRAPATPRAVIASPTPTSLPPIDSTTLITVAYGLAQLEDVLTAFGVPKEVIGGIQIALALVAVLKIVSETQKANAEIAKAAVAKLELEVAERGAREKRDPYYKIMLRQGTSSAVLRFELQEGAKLKRLDDVLRLCLERADEDPSQGSDVWEFVVEEELRSRVLGYEDDVVGELLQRGMLLLRKKTS